jgi:hypothetical protein
LREVVGHSRLAADLGPTLMKTQDGRLQLGNAPAALNGLARKGVAPLAIFDCQKTEQVGRAEASITLLEEVAQFLNIARFVFLRDPPRLLNRVVVIAFRRRLPFEKLLLTAVAVGVGRLLNSSQPGQTPPAGFPKFAKRRGRLSPVE